MALKVNGSINDKAGQTVLDKYLSTRSYIEGYTPSQSDVVVFSAIKSIQGGLLNATRWFNHIKSFEKEFGKLPEVVKKSLKDFGITDAEAAPAGRAAPAAAAAGDDDVDDLFASDDEADAEAERVRQERLAAYAEKKAKKPGVIAKSNVILDIKPWDDETDMKAMEDAVRTIVMDGLVWGISKLVPVAFGVKKLQIVCVVEDLKVSIDELSEKIAEFEDFVQSVDIAAFQKI